MLYNYAAKTEKTPGLTLGVALIVSSYYGREHVQIGIANIRVCHFVGTLVPFDDIIV